MGRLAVGATVAALAARGNVDPDLWGHLRFGLDALAAGHLTPVDPYSFTQDVPWINHEWLSEVVFAAAYRTAGVTGLVGVKTVLVFSAALAVSRAMRERTPAAAWWLAAALLALTPSALSFRPHLWTLVGIALLVMMLARGGLAWWTPLVFALWANVHGGWIVGIGLIAAWGTGRLVDRRTLALVRRDIVIASAALAATLATPYGWRLWIFLLTTVRPGRDITEWQPLWRQPDASHFALWLLTSVCVAVACATRWHRLTWSARVPVLLFAVLGLRIDRMAPLFGLVSVLVLAEAWRRDSPASAAGDDSSASVDVAARAVDATVVAAVWMLGAVPIARCLPVAGDWIPDREAAAALAAGTTPGRLVLPFDWGEYAIWHVGPRLRVSIDGRNETIYSPEVVATQTAILDGAESGLAFLARERPEYVWLPNDRGAVTLGWLEARGYRRDVRTARSSIAVRADLPTLATHPPLPACFP